MGCAEPYPGTVPANEGGWFFHVKLLYARLAAEDPFAPELNVHEHPAELFFT